MATTAPTTYDPRWRNPTPDAIRETIRRRDEASHEAIDELFEAAVDEIAEGVEPEEALLNVFGLEPDYIFDGEFLRAVRAAWSRGNGDGKGEQK